jgi:hypothetical protein
MDWLKNQQMSYYHQDILAPRDSCRAVLAEFLTVSEQLHFPNSIREEVRPLRGPAAREDSRPTNFGG